MVSGQRSAVGGRRSRETRADLQPDEALAEHIGAIPRGRALDLGMGDGDTALWLAARGYEVEGVDIDAAALRRAEKRALRLRLRVQTYLVDMADYVILPDTYDLIVAGAALHFLHPGVLAALAPRIVVGLRPGGYLYATALTTDDPGYRWLREAGAREVASDTFDVSEAGQPGTLRYFGQGVLRELFGGLEVVEYTEERYLRPDAAQGYNAAAVLLARKRP